MKRILITGGNGTLGRQLVASLQEKSIVRVMSRHPQSDNTGNQVEWAQADVTTGEGVTEALQQADIIVNCLSSPMADTYEADIKGTKNLLAQAKHLGVQYVLHISIIGIDRIIYRYYQYKLGAELVVVESGIPYAIARIGQFHSFVDYLLSPLKQAEGDEVSIPVDVKFQPIDTTDVVAHLAPYILEATYQGRLPDFAGPDILNLKDLASSWLKAQGMSHAIKPATDEAHDLPFLNYVGDGFVKGYNTNKNNRIGKISWQDYLDQTYGAK